MFCIYLRTNSDLCHLQHKLIGFYNRDEMCLLRGTNLVFVFKGLNKLDANACLHELVTYIKRRTNNDLALTHIFSHANNKGKFIGLNSFQIRFVYFT